MENSVGLSYEKGEDYTEADLLERNKSFLDQITRGLGMQQVRVAGQNFQYIKTPIASLNYKCLHPLLYRNVGNIGELDQLAQILAAPSEWKQYYNEKVAPNSCVARKFYRLRNLPDDETAPNIQAAFSTLVISVGDSLNINLNESRDSDVIGGILAQGEICVRGQTGTYFQNNEDIPVLASVVTTLHEFGFGEMWHHESRSPCVFTTLFARNAPTVLLNQRQWKLFIENADRSAVLTFPYEDDDTDDHGRSPFLKSTLVQMMGTTLLKVICICALAKPGRPADEDQLKPPATPPPLKSYFNQQNCKDMAEAPTKKCRTIDSGLPTLSIGTGSTNRNPTFVSGFDANGEEIRSVVSVASPNTLKEIQGAIEAEARKEQSERRSVCSQ